MVYISESGKEILIEIVVGSFWGIGYNATCYKLTDFEPEYLKSNKVSPGLCYMLGKNLPIWTYAIAIFM